MLTVLGCQWLKTSNNVVLDWALIDMLQFVCFMYVFSTTLLAFPISFLLVALALDMIFMYGGD